MVSHNHPSMHPSPWQMPALVPLASGTRVKAAIYKKNMHFERKEPAWTWHYFCRMRKPLPVLVEVADWELLEL